MRARSMLSVAAAVAAVAAVALGACAHKPPATHDHHAHAGASPRVAEVGFVVAAPDRGFLGNEEVADAVAVFAKTHAAAVAYVTDQRTAGELQTAVGGLARRGVKRVVVLPLFLSRAERGFQELERSVAALGGAPKAEVPVSLGAPLGESYLAVELLGDRLRELHHTRGIDVIVAGYGAATDGDRDALAADLTRIATAAAAGFDLASVGVVVWRDRDSLAGERDQDAETEMAAALRAHPAAVVVPFQLGPKLDSMMTFAAGLGRYAQGDVTIAGADITPDPLLPVWMAQEANRAVPLADDDIGVVFLAHGSDHHWNQGMREAVAGLAARYDIEVSFSMADQPLVERAIRKLEARGKRGIVVVRVFGLRSSFQRSVENMLGIDVAAHAAHAAHGAHGHGHGHGHGMPAAAPPPRIRSASLFATQGGLEDHPRFAAALLDRARALSKDPARETVVLVAHGSGDDAANDHWKGVLASLATQMGKGDGAAFRAIEVGTWREDWPGKREPEVAAIRAIVEAASRDGGRALVIPARTTAQGPERELLDGLAYELGSGFAPHAQFEAWFEEQIQAGLKQLGGHPPGTAHAHHHH